MGDWFSSIHAPQIGKPDIVIYGECPGIVYTPMCGGISCRQGELKTIISNEGEGNIAKNLTFTICAKDKAGVELIKQEVSGLKIGQEKAFQYPSISGDITLVADCYDQVAELDESNNVLEFNCPKSYLVNCYIQTSSSPYSPADCPSYCNIKTASKTGGDMSCWGVDAKTYPDKLINLTDCGQCPSDDKFEGGCYCPANCKLYWDEQIGPGASCGGKISELGFDAGYAGCGLSKNQRGGLISKYFPVGSYFPDYSSKAASDNAYAPAFQRTAEFCSCSSLWDPDPECKSNDICRESIVPRIAQCAWFETTQVLPDCSTVCVEDNQHRGCFCPMNSTDPRVTTCGGKEFVLPGETCKAVEE